MSSLRLSLLYTPLTHVGGAERQFLEEVRALRALGHDVAVLTFDVAEEALFVEGVDEESISVLRGRGPLGRTAALRRYLARERPDLLVSHTSPEMTWLATRGSPSPYVLYHNSPPFYIGPSSNPAMLSRRYRRVFARIRESVTGYADLYREPRAGLGRRAVAELRAALKHLAFRGAGALFVLSERTRGELAQLHGVDAVVVRGCLPTPLPRLPRTSARAALGLNGSPVTLSVCRLEAVKRVDLLVRAFARVRRHVADTQLVVVGQGAERERLERLAAELGVADAVRFAGFVPDDELWTYYAAADVFAAPAMADFNIAPYEALAMGCRVVWTSEMETDAEIESSGWIVVVEPTEASLARGLEHALTAPDSDALDLSGMTWSARVALLEAYYRTAIARAR